MPASFVGSLGLAGAERDAVSRRIDTQQSQDPQLRTVLNTGDCRIASSGLPVRRFAQSIVLGRLHGEHGNRPALDEGWLIEHCWGGYVAIAAGNGEASLLRAPLGDLPCYWMPHGAGAIAASSPRLVLEAAGRVPRIAWTALARHLAFGTISTGETCLDGIRDLRGGDQLLVGSGGIHRITRWSPWRFAAARRHGQRAAEEAERLRQIIVAAVEAATRGQKQLLLKLSGGLDSSIVAAALAAAGRPFACMTMYTDDASGDERGYARAVATHLGVRLTEGRRDPARLDLDTSPSARLARPSLPGFRQEADRLADAAASARGATAVVDGGGGDNVFCSLQSASVVADCLLDWRGLASTGRTARSLASIAQVSVAHVLRRALVRAMSGRYRHRWQRDTLFLSRELAQSVPPQPDHPWLIAPVGMPPGRLGHVALIAAAQSYVEGFDRQRDPPTLAPLLAQPVVEHCLSVPSWRWYDDGLNRALARRAFAGDLPASVLRRRSKGSPECFVAQAFELHRKAIRERLLGGLLAEAGLLDLPALALALNDSVPPLEWSLDRIMSLLDAEIWARHWAG